MARNCVWAFAELRVLGYKTAFVECEQEVFDTLIALNRGQDPRIGATPLIFIGAPVPALLPDFQVPSPYTREDFMTREELEARAAPPAPKPALGPTAFTTRRR